MGERGVRRLAVRQYFVALGIALGFAAGCAPEFRSEPIVSGSPAMLFDVNRASALSATGFGRTEWPATQGRLESVEETVFVEYYRDYQGSATLERANPHQWFRSYRIGSQIR